MTLPDQIFFLVVLLEFTMSTIDLLISQYWQNRHCPYCKLGNSHHHRHERWGKPIILLLTKKKLWFPQPLTTKQQWIFHVNLRQTWAANYRQYQRR